MAAPLPTKKTTVDLGKDTPRRVSRIRRDPPPPPEKPLSAAEVRQREGLAIVIGIVATALALIVLAFQLSNIAGWRPGTIVINLGSN